MDLLVANLLQDLQDDEVTQSKLEELARKYNFLTGKWMMYIPWSKANDIWQKSIKKLLDGTLKNVLYVKIDTKDERPESVYDKDRTKICFITPDFTNSQQIRDV